MRPDLQAEVDDFIVRLDALHDKLIAELARLRGGAFQSPETGQAETSGTLPFHTQRPGWSRAREETEQ